MKFSEYSHRHGKEILSLTHPNEMKEIISTLNELQKFPHGSTKGKTPKEYIASAFETKGWEREKEIPLGEHKSDFCDLFKNRIAIEQEYSRFEMFLRDFFRFLLLYDEGNIDVGIIITYDETVFERWEKAVKPYRSARASLQKLIDFLRGKYRTVVRVPLWCIGIE
jgi:hypothetical protein